MTTGLMIGIGIVIAMMGLANLFSRIGEPPSDGALAAVFLGLCGICLIVGGVISL